MPTRRPAVKPSGAHADIRHVDEQPYAVSSSAASSIAMNPRRSHLTLAVVIFLSPAVWALLLLTVVFPDTFYDAGRHHEPSLPGQLAAVAGVGMLGLLVPIGIGMWRRSRTGLGLGLATCVSMVLVGVTLVSTISTVRLVRVASLHLVAAGATTLLLLLSRSTRGEFTRTDAARDDAMWSAIESAAVTEARPVNRAEPLNAPMPASGTPPPLPSAAAAAPAFPASTDVRVAWRDFDARARLLLAAAAVFAVLAGLSDRVIMNGVGAVVLPTSGSVVFAAAALGCGFIAVFMARSAHQRRMRTVADLEGGGSLQA